MSEANSSAGAKSAGATAALAQRLERLLGSPVARVDALHGGMVAEVRLAELVDGRRVVAKSSTGVPLEVEGAMLEFLARGSVLPVPAVLHAQDDLLLLDYLEGDSLFNEDSERHGADLLAALHDVRSDDGFGFPFDTLIGPFAQENAWSASWPQFFAERRLRPMLEVCRERERLPEAFHARVLALLEDVEKLISHGPEPSLIHGDVWAGNVRAKDGRITGVLDPALYFADAEVELAFIDLFGTFGPAFWQRYAELRSIDPGYDLGRRDLYQLYPLLVHVALFGGGYVSGVEERLERLGY